MAMSKGMKIGCGVGVVSEHLNNNYKMKVIGTDVDPKQIKIAKVLARKEKRNGSNR